MSKKKLSKRRTVNKQTVNRSNKKKVGNKRSRIIVVLSFLGKHLVGTILDAIFEPQVKELLSVVVKLVKSILASI